LGTRFYVRYDRTPIGSEPGGVLCHLPLKAALRSSLRPQCLCQILGVGRGSDGIHEIHFSARLITKSSAQKAKGVNSRRVTWEPPVESRPPNPRPKESTALCRWPRSPQVQRLAFVPDASTTASSLSLGADNDCFWRELAVRATGDSNGRCWRWVSCGNKLGPGLYHATAYLATYRGSRSSKVDPIAAQLTRLTEPNPRLMEEWLAQALAESLSGSPIPLPTTPAKTPLPLPLPRSQAGPPSY
jgi:hypothetical protein